MDLYLYIYIFFTFIYFAYNNVVFCFYNNSKLEFPISISLESGLKNHVTIVKYV